MTAWIGIIGTLLGAFLGGSFALLSARFQQRAQTERDRNRLILSKMEELFSLLGEYRVVMATDFFRTIDLVKTMGPLIGEMEENQELFKPDFPINSKEEINILPPKEKMDILVGFYAPELFNQYDTIRNRLAAYGKASADVGHLMFFDNREEARKVAVIQLNQRAKEIDLACQRMQAETVLVARKYI